MTVARQVVGPYREFLAVAAETAAADLEKFVALLLKWNHAQNLVSRETGTQLWQRHVADSLQVLRYLNESDRRIVDIGSGGGFPSVPVAIGSRDRRQLILVEPNTKKASFLRAVGRELDLDLRVENSRAEALEPARFGRIDVITSRALASLTELCALAAPFFGPETRAIFHKGREHVEELAEAGASWRFDVLIHPSDTNEHGVLLELKKLSRKVK